MHLIINFWSMRCMPWPFLWLLKTPFFRILNVLLLGTLLIVIYLMSGGKAHLKSHGALLKRMRPICLTRETIISTTWLSSQVVELISRKDNESSDQPDAWHAKISVRRRHHYRCNQQYKYGVPLLIKSMQFILSST